MSGQLDDVRMSELYVLDSNNRPVRTTKDFFEDFIRNSDRRIVGKEVFDVNGVKIVISTVFTGFSCNCCFFQSMILGGEFSESSWSYETYEQAKAGHDQIVMAYREHFASEESLCE